MCDTENNQEKEHIYLEYVLDNKIGGIIFSEGISIPVIEQAQKYTKTVLIDRHMQEGVVSEVSSDNFAGGKNATEYLIQLNHHAIGFINGPDDWPSAEDRFAGYRAALEKHHIPYRPELVYQGDFQFDSGSSALEYFLTLPQWPTAIFSANDQMAFGVLSKARSMNISIPEDISLIGFDDIPFYSLYNTKLTTVQQDIKSLCARAFETLMKDINEELTEKQKIVIPTKLKVGETCRKLIGSNNDRSWS